eukprot:gene9988-6971_t
MSYSARKLRFFVENFDGELDTAFLVAKSFCLAEDDGQLQEIAPLLHPEHSFLHNSFWGLARGPTAAEAVLAAEKRYLTFTWTTPLQPVTSRCFTREGYVRVHPGCRQLLLQASRRKVVIADPQAGSSVASAPGAPSGPDAPGAASSSWFSRGATGLLDGWYDPYRERGKVLQRFSAMVSDSLAWSPFHIISSAWSFAFQKKVTEYIVVKHGKVVYRDVGYDWCIGSESRHPDHEDITHAEKEEKMSNRQTKDKRKDFRLNEEVVLLTTSDFLYRFAFFSPFCMSYNNSNPPFICQIFHYRYGKIVSAIHPTRDVRPTDSPAASSTVSWEDTVALVDTSGYASDCNFSDLMPQHAMKPYRVMATMELIKALGILRLANQQRYKSHASRAASIVTEEVLPSNEGEALEQQPPPSPVEQDKEREENVSSNGAADPDPPRRAQPKTSARPRRGHTLCMPRKKPRSVKKTPTPLATPPASSYALPNEVDPTQHVQALTHGEANEKTTDSRRNRVLHRAAHLHLQQQQLEAKKEEGGGEPETLFPPRCRAIVPPLIPISELERVHAVTYLGNLGLHNTASWRWQPNTSRAVFSVDCPPVEGIMEHSIATASGTVMGAVLLNARRVRTAIHWGGGMHHAKCGECSGFCYINDIVLAITELLKAHERVLYIDLDVHHGDGVDEAFCQSDRVFTLSLHKFGDSFFPGTGHPWDIGYGKGRFYTMNVGLWDGINDFFYTSIFKQALHTVCEAFRPEAVVLQCGADSLGGDRLGSFNLSSWGHGECVRCVKATGLPVLAVGGGGYTIRNVAKLWAYETSILCGVQLPTSTPIPVNKMPLCGWLFDDQPLLGVPADATSKPPVGWHVQKGFRAALRHIQRHGEQLREAVRNGKIQQQPQHAKEEEPFVDSSDICGSPRSPQGEGKNEHDRPTTAAGIRELECILPDVTQSHRRNTYVEEEKKPHVGPHRTAIQDMRKYVKFHRLTPAARVCGRSCRRDEANHRSRGRSPHSDLSHRSRLPEDHFVPYPLLCVPLLTGQLPSMEILLATPRPIDFTVTEDEMGDTILHLLSKTQESREEVAWLLSKIIDRVKCHPDDIINWAALNKDDVNPIGSAVAAGFLSVWANTVLHEKPVPYFSEAEHPESILIPDGVDPEDWDHLSPNDKRRFEISTNLNSLLFIFFLFIIIIIILIILRMSFNSSLVLTLNSIPSPTPRIVCVYTHDAIHLTEKSRDPVEFMLIVEHKRMKNFPSCSILFFPPVLSLLFCFALYSSPPSLPLYHPYYVMKVLFDERQVNKPNQNNNNNNSTSKMAMRFLPLSLFIRTLYAVCYTILTNSTLIFLFRVFYLSLLFFMTAIRYFFSPLFLPTVVMETTSPPRKRGRTEEQLRLTLEDAINVFQKIVNRPNHTPLSSKAIAELTACIQAGVDINVKRTQHPKEAVLKYFIHNGKELSCERLLQASRTTGRLCSLGQQLLLSTPKQRLALQSSILEEARQCVDDGADVMIKATHFFDRPLLATSMAKLPIDFSEILLRAQHPIDFTAVDSTGFTVLHFIPMVKENEGVARLLHLVLNRVQQHPEDRIDWTLQTMFYNAPTDYAAIHSHLAVWVKILVHDRPVAYFTQAGRDAHRISIREKVSKKDWEQLPPEDQNRFCLEKGFKT